MSVSSQPQQPSMSSSSQPQQQPIIPKVCEQLRDAAGKHLFAPQTVLIGPYHRREEGSCSFPWTEEKKKKAVLSLQNLRGGDLEDMKQLLAELWPEVRKCYTHLPDDHMDAEALRAGTMMLLRDGCYLLSFFIEFSGGGDGGDKNDNTLVRDILFLLENQIPLFVLDRMLRHISPPGETRSATECIAIFVTEELQKQRYISKTPRQLVQSEFVPSHLLHLVYYYFRRLQQDREPAQPEGRRTLTGRWRRATDYTRYADLRFKPRVFTPDDQYWTILDINLQGGTLYIPFLQVSNSTWTMLRNLMALEEQEEKRPVTAYCYFMSQVACTAEDVDLLQRAKILEHFLGDDNQAAKGFAVLCHGVALDINNLERNYLKPIWHDLDKRCGKRMHTFKGFFRHEYFGNVFYQIVFFVALLLSMCQVTQAIYAVIAYHRPPKAN